MPDQLARQAAGVGLLADPVRRALYDHVCAQPEPVGRVAAAEAVGVAEHTAKFHLDRLVAEGLLITEFRRLSGRTGPGAGRPAKLYRRSDLQVDLTLPRRRYELLGRLLARAVARAGAEQRPVADVVRAVARETGVRLGSQVRPVAPPSDELDAVADAVAEQGYEPTREPDVVRLANCPFHAAVEEDRDLVCGLNLALLDGVVEGLGCLRVAARLDPGPDRCCVAVVRHGG
ncbi:transcriptional regulator [Angustibacter peucedani]